MNVTKMTAFCMLGACTMLLSSAVYSQSFPSKPVRMVVPYPAGGTTEIVARVVAQKLSMVWGRW